MTASTTSGKPSRLRTLTDEYRDLAARLRQGGGAERLARMHAQGKLGPRERVQGLLDPGGPWLELGLLVAYGYKPTRILLLALILGVGLSQVFRQAAEQGVFIPKTAPGELKPGGCGPDWTKCQAQPFVPIVYSFDTMLPLKLGQADKWSVERKPFQLRVAGREMAFPEWALQPLIWVEILFGWLTSGIILALDKATLVAGETVFERGVHTGALPGGLARV